jgi:hypothetical protein
MPARDGSHFHGSVVSRRFMKNCATKCLSSPSSERRIGLMPCAEVKFQIHDREREERAVHAIEQTAVPR